MGTPRRTPTAGELFSELYGAVKQEAEFRRAVATAEVERQERAPVLSWLNGYFHGSGDISNAVACRLEDCVQDYAEFVCAAPGCDVFLDDSTRHDTDPGYCWDCGEKAEQAARDEHDNRAYDLAVDRNLSLVHGGAA